MQSLEQKPGRVQADCPAGNPFPVRPKIAEPVKGRFKAAVGRVVLGICIADKKECNNRHCILQPFCACARAELQKAGKAESRIWLAVAICGGVLIFAAFLRIFVSG